MKLSFQFTHPMWGATVVSVSDAVVDLVSIHAPRVGCDLIRRRKNGTSTRFNSRTPCGVRLVVGLSTGDHQRLFQFTHPVWGATGSDCFDFAGVRVSIHAPRVGCDSMREPPFATVKAFQFTHPVWGATADSRTDKQYKQMFQFTHPVWGATRQRTATLPTTTVSIHAPRVGCDY